MLGFLKNEFCVIEVNAWRDVSGAIMTSFGKTVVDLPHMLLGDELWVHISGRSVCLKWVPAVDYYAASVASEAADTAVAPMPGAVVSINCAVGDHVMAGDPILVIESMKLETVIRAPRAGKIETLPFGKGATFERGAVLAILGKE